MNAGSDSAKLEPQSESIDDMFKDFTYDKLMLVQSQLRKFILNQVDLARTLQPHLNFDTDNLDKNNVHYIMTMSRNPQTQEWKNMKKGKPKVIVRAATSLDDIASKTDSEYIMASFDKLNN